MAAIEARSINAVVNRTRLVIATLGLSLADAAVAQSMPLTKWERYQRWPRLRRGVVAAKDVRSTWSISRPRCRIIRRHDHRHDPKPARPPRCWSQRHGERPACRSQRRSPDLQSGKQASPGSTDNRAVTAVADGYRGKKLIAPNDLTTDDQGRIYFTDSRLVSEDLSLNAIYRLDGALDRAGTDQLRPNGRRRGLLQPELFAIS